jgi:hypothetical protein
MTGLGKVVHIRARTAFMDVRRGDESVLPLDATVQGWINAGLVDLVEELLVTFDETPILVTEEVADGTDPAGPGSVEPDAAGSKPSGRRRSR